MPRDSIAVMSDHGVCVGAIVQARMGSSRLPGKVMLPAVGKPLLGHLVERLRFCKNLNKIIVATSQQKADDAIAEFCTNMGIALFCGSERDVLDRYYQAASTFDLEVIVRITADCPLIDPELVDEMVQFFLQHRDQFELVTNRHPLTYPDGLDVDVMPFSALKHAWQEAAEPHQREHTIPYFWEAGRSVFNFEHPDRLFFKYRWTVDYPEDYDLVRQIFDALYREGELFTMQDILGFLEACPELARINAHYIALDF